MKQLKEIKKDYWKLKDEYYKKFVDSNVPFGGDGDAWPGEEGTEYEDRFKEEITPHDLWVWISTKLK